MRLFFTSKWKKKQESLMEERGPWYSLDVKVWSNTSTQLSTLPEHPGPRVSVGWVISSYWGAAYLLGEPLPLLLQHVGHIIPLRRVLGVTLPLFLKVQDHLPNRLGSLQHPAAPASRTAQGERRLRTPPKAKWHGSATTAAWHPNSTRKSHKSSFWTSYTVLLFGIVEPVCERS